MSGVNNVYTNNLDDQVGGNLNFIGTCAPVTLACAGAVTLPTHPITSNFQYPVMLSGNRQTGVSMLANNQIVASVGFNNVAALGQLDLIAANQNALIAFYTPKTTGLSITAISTAANAVLTVGSVPAEVVAGSYVYIFGATGSCAYLSTQPQGVVSATGTTITIQTLGSTCTYTSGRR